MLLKMMGTLDAISRSTDLPLAELGKWTPNDFRRWAGEERARALAERDQRIAKARTFERIADQLRAREN
jgi:hypothetical protein